MTILVDYSSTNIRLFFRLYFVILFQIITITGNKCCANTIKLRVLKGQQVQLTGMTGWLQTFASISSLIKLRALPGGWLGLLMILSYSISVASDLVSTTIKTVTVQGRCSFGTGLVVSSIPLIPQYNPPHNGAPYFVVSQAQITSQINGGLKGIYSKVNRDPRFSADTKDVLGGWACTQSKTELKYSYDVPIRDVVADVVRAGLLYDLPDPPFCSSVSSFGDGKNLTTHVVIWDTSAGVSLEDTFDVRASIDISANGKDKKIMKSFECKLQSNDSMEELSDIQRAIPSRSALNSWCEVAQGAMYNGTGTPASTNSQGILEEALNSMIIIGGGNNYLLNNTASDQTQGCILPRTLVPWGVVILAALATGLGMLLLLYWPYLLVSIRFANKGRSQEEIKISKYHIPTDLLAWMLQAVKESQTGRTLAQKKAEAMASPSLKEWEFGVRDGSRLGVARK